MPVETWSDFYALMTTKDIFHLLPKNKNKGNDTDWETLKKMSYLNWAHGVDNKVGHLNGKSEMDGAGRTVSMVWRSDIEGAWVQNAVRVYEEEVARLGDVFKEKPRVREGLQWSLRKIIEKVFMSILFKKTTKLANVDCRDSTQGLASKRIGPRKAKACHVSFG